MKIHLKSLVVIFILATMVAGCSNGEESRAYKKVNMNDLEAMEAYYSIEVQDPETVSLVDVKKAFEGDADLEYWSNTKVVCAYTNMLVEDDDCQKPWMLLCYITDQNGKELYKLLRDGSPNIQYGFLEVGGIEFADINADGLKDIVIIAAYEHNWGGESFFFHYVYYQQKEGFIYDSLISNLLTAGETVRDEADKRGKDMDLIVEDAQKFLLEDEEVIKFHDELLKEFREKNASEK